MEEMTLDEVANRMWCEKNNLQVLDESCHNAKTKAENKLRRQHKKEKKVNVKQRN
jgi:5-methylcytosine-specific restriction endonuclease McrA